MKLLAIDTSTQACSAALQLGEQTRYRYQVAPKEHAGLILPMINELMQEAGCSLSQLDALAFACGPGSFTGIRIAASVIQGLAFSADLPVIPISTLVTVAQGVYRNHQSKAVWVVMDARMNQVYQTVCRVSDLGLMSTVTDETLSDPDSLTAPEQPGLVGAGHGWDRYADVLPSLAGETFPDSLPDARDVVSLAAYEFEQGNTKPPELALPIYLRDNVVN